MRRRSLLPSPFCRVTQFGMALWAVVYALSVRAASITVDLLDQLIAGVFLFPGVSPSAIGNPATSRPSVLPRPSLVPIIGVQYEVFVDAAESLTIADQHEVI